MDSLQSLRRRKSVSASFSAKTAAASHQSPSTELQLITPAFHSYSSLRDILPVNSPRPKAFTPRPDIRIRNRLVKQAALAYLQPMSTTSGSTGGVSLRRLWTRVAAFFDFLCGNVFRDPDGPVRVNWIRFSKMWVVID